MQINRLFEIIYILLDKKTTTANELAKRFEVSPRTIYRDVESLSSSGIPIFMNRGKGGGISLLPNFILNKTILTDDEKLNILSSLRAVDAVNLDKTSTAIDKLSSLFGESNPNWIEVDFLSWGDGEKEKNAFNNLKYAIINKTAVSFSYHSGKGESSKRIVEPLKLCFKGQSWYLYAFCKSRQDFRFFKLSRINELTYKKDLVTKTIPQQVLADNNTMYSDNNIKLTLKISPNSAYRVFDEFNNYEKQSDGSYIITLDFPNNEWLYSYILSYGEDCEVLKPDFLRNKIKEKLIKMQKFY